MTSLEPVKVNGRWINYPGSSRQHLLRGAMYLSTGTVADTACGRTGLLIVKSMLFPPGEVPIKACKTCLMVQRAEQPS